MGMGFREAILLVKHEFILYQLLSQIDGIFIGREDGYYLFCLID
jgi:hypothetical protein